MGYALRHMRVFSLTDCNCFYENMFEKFEKENSLELTKLLKIALTAVQNFVYINF